VDFGEDALVHPLVGGELGSVVVDFSVDDQEFMGRFIWGLHIA
jgi:hypothetical protein